jgi:hypothetical protein
MTNPTKPLMQARFSAAIARIFALAMLFSIQTPLLEAQQAETSPLHSEYTIKGVFLYSFGRNVEWPNTAFADDSDPFIIGILGEDPFEGILDEIAEKKTIHGRKIVIRRFASVQSYKPPCQILFVGRSLTPEQQAVVIAKTEGQPVLVVGESPGFAERGAAVNFFSEGDRIVFEINSNAARRAGLSMDAKLLSLGKPLSVERAPTN